MALVQLATDNFQRGSYPENPLSDNGNWSIFDSYTACQVVSPGYCEPSVTATICTAIWTGLTWSNDQYSEVKIQSATVNYGTNPLCRAGNNSGYMALISGMGTNTQFLRYYSSFSGNTFTTLTSASATVAVNDIWRLQAIGSAILVTQNGNTILSATDSSKLTGGSPGLYMNSSGGGLNAVQFSLWNGGGVASTTPAAFGPSGQNRWMSGLRDIS